MNFQLETTDVAIARSFSRAVTFRDSFELNQETDYLNNYKVVSGSGVSMSGREIQLAAKFQDGNGCAVLVIYAPDSRGEILETVLQDIFPEHQGSTWIAENLGITLGDLDTYYAGVKFSGDLGERNFE